jgi:hypothetical protein
MNIYFHVCAETINFERQTREKKSDRRKDGFNLKSEKRTTDRGDPDLVGSAVVSAGVIPLILLLRLVGLVLVFRALLAREVAL